MAKARELVKEAKEFFESIFDCPGQSKSLHSYLKKTAPVGPQRSVSWLIRESNQPGMLTVDFLYFNGQEPHTGYVRLAYEPKTKTWIHVPDEEIAKHQERIKPITKEDFQDEMKSTAIDTAAAKLLTLFPLKINVGNQFLLTLKPKYQAKPTAQLASKLYGGMWAAENKASPNKGLQEQKADKKLEERPKTGIAMRGKRED